MICPHCEYAHGWDADILDHVSGEHGDFFTLSNNIQAERFKAHGFSRTTKDVYFCPACKISFID